MKTQGYTIHIDELDAGAYQVSLIPSVEHGPMGITRYPNKDSLRSAFRRHLGYTDAETESFCAGGEQHKKLMNVQLSDDDAAALWSPRL
jgi:hypothetical protein